MLFKKKNNSLRRLTIAIAVVMIWRSLWNLLDMYFLPEYELLSNILTLIIGLAILYIPDKSIKELVD